MLGHWARQPSAEWLQRHRYDDAASGDGSGSSPSTDARAQLGYSKDGDDNSYTMYSSSLSITNASPAAPPVPFNPNDTLAGGSGGGSRYGGAARTWRGEDGLHVVALVSTVHHYYHNTSIFLHASRSPCLRTTMHE